MLGTLSPKRVLAIGESQSAGFLTTYINAVDMHARVFDGFLVHSRFGSAAAIDGARGPNGNPGVPRHVRFRTDLRVPVLTFITETDLVGARLAGYHASRQAENRRLRVWEVTGTAHADNYVFGGSFMDSGLRTNAELARIFLPTTKTVIGELAKPANEGMAHHYVLQAALRTLDSWVRTGKAPASTKRIELASGGREGEEARVALDDRGLGRGGIRTPWVDVPTLRLSGSGNSGGFAAMLAGTGEPIDSATLMRLYPGGKSDYLKRFEPALDGAIRAGHILADDRQEILEIAAINFPAAP
jgi:hypothetical protein